MKNIFILILLFVWFSGCSSQIAHKDRPPASPREEASTQLTHEGLQRLQEGNFDGAVRLLEQAIGLNPNNGQSYYYLARAWLKKGMFSEAKEFNRQARTYLKDDNDWLMRVEKQAMQISRMEKQ